MKAALLILATAAGVLATLGTGAQPAGEPPAPAPPRPGWIVARLTALTPEHPEEYVALAEEVADASAEPGEDELARTLYALAYEIARAKLATAPLAASACLGLASLERLEPERRWLFAVGAAIDPRYARTDWAVAASASPSDETAFEAATVLGLARAGEGLQARKLLDQPGVRDLLIDYERVGAATGAKGAFSALERAIAEWPCPQCRNERAITRPGPTAPETRMCPTCRGDPGPRLSPDDFLIQLRFEAILLRGVQRSWAAQVAVDMGAPLRDPDPEQLAAAYGVDAKRPYWREGQWVSGAEAGR